MIPSWYQDRDPPGPLRLMKAPPESAEHESFPEMHTNLRAKKIFKFAPLKKSRGNFHCKMNTKLLPFSPAQNCMPSFEKCGNTLKHCC